MDSLLEIRIGNRKESDAEIRVPIIGREDKLLNVLGNLSSSLARSVNPNAQKLGSSNSQPSKRLARIDSPVRCKNVSVSKVF